MQHYCVYFKDIDPSLKEQVDNWTSENAEYHTTSVLSSNKKGTRNTPPHNLVVKFCDETDVRKFVRRMSDLHIQVTYEEIA